EPHVHSVGHSERSDAVVEPYLSTQWFVSMDSLAKKSLDNQDSGDTIDFVPERFDATFRRWMEEIRDWCISRQLWWGQQIYDRDQKKTGESQVGMEATAE